MKKDGINTTNNKTKRNEKGLHFAIPLSLIVVGSCLILTVLYISFVKPFFEYDSMFFDQGSKTTSFAPSTYVSSGDIIPEIKYSAFGEQMGTLSIPTADIVNSPIFHGDEPAELQKGIGHFIGSHYPGEGGKIVLDAHRTTNFKTLGKVQIGDMINLQTSYGSYSYKIYDIEVIPGTVDFVEPDDSREYVVLYTCYPFDGIGFHWQRFVVYANLVTGTKVRIPNQ